MRVAEHLRSLELVPLDLLHRLEPLLRPVLRLRLGLHQLQRLGHRGVRRRLQVVRGVGVLRGQQGVPCRVVHHAIEEHLAGLV